MDAPEHASLARVGATRRSQRTARSGRPSSMTRPWVRQAMAAPPGRMPPDQAESSPQLAECSRSSARAAESPSRPPLAPTPLGAGWTRFRVAGLRSREHREGKPRCAQPPARRRTAGGSERQRPHGDQAGRARGRLGRARLGLPATQRQQVPGREREVHRESSLEQRTRRVRSPQLARVGPRFRCGALPLATQLPSDLVVGNAAPFLELLAPLLYLGQNAQVVETS